MPGGVPGGTLVSFPIAKKDVASFLGLTPETLSRKLAHFEVAGWVRPLPRRVEILDRAALARI